MGFRSQGNNNRNQQLEILREEFTDRVVKFVQLKMLGFQGTIIITETYAKNGIYNK